MLKENRILFIDNSLFNILLSIVVINLAMIEAVGINRSGFLSLISIQNLIFSSILGLIIGVIISIVTLVMIKKIKKKTILYFSSIILILAAGYSLYILFAVTASC